MHTATSAPAPGSGQGPTRPLRVVVINPKGGSGKTTIATNLAAYFARIGGKPTLIDYDPQGSTTHWLSLRPSSAPPIHGIAAFERRMDVTRSFQLRVPHDCRYVVVDTPASYDTDTLRTLTRDASKVIMPVLPSRFDMHAASRAIADLLLVAKLDRRSAQLGIVANRTRKNTRTLDKLMRFLDSLDIPVVATLRDVQAYVRASEQGLGIYDFRPHEYAREAPSWQALAQFLRGRSATMAALAEPATGAERGESAPGAREATDASVGAATPRVTLDE